MTIVLELINYHTYNKMLYSKQHVASLIMWQDITCCINSTEDYVLSKSNNCLYGSTVERPSAHHIVTMDMQWSQWQSQSSINQWSRLKSQLFCGA